MQLVIASHNLGKIREFREMFRALPQIDVISLLNFPEYKPPPEVGETFEAIAAAKATDAAAVLNRWVIADDSGLVVPSLNGAPGIFSRRYAGEEASDSENNRKLLQAMEKMTDLQRFCYYFCALALASPEGLCKIFTGKCEGLLLREEKGRNGFGYDPLFLKHDYDKTFAELDESIKNRISHRRKAFEKLALALENLHR